MENNDILAVAGGIIAGAVFLNRQNTNLVLPDMYILIQKYQRLFRALRYCKFPTTTTTGFWRKNKYPMQKPKTRI